ncbi:hypothetical protein ACQY0O_000753 [Thecaphora frezii]
MSGPSAPSQPRHPGSGGAQHRARGRGGRARGRGAARAHGRPATFSHHHRHHHRDNGYGDRTANPSVPSQAAAFACDYVDLAAPLATTSASTLDSTDEHPGRCRFSCSSQLALMLHKADRHLIYPEGGIEELRRRDPMLIAEERERQRRLRSRHRDAPAASAKPKDRSARVAATGRAEQAGDGDDDHDHDDDDAGSVEADARLLDGPPDATIAGLNIQLNTPELIAEWIRQRKKRWPTRENVEQKAKEAEERRKRSQMIYGERAVASRGARLRDRPHDPASAGNTDTQDKRPDKRPKVESVANDAAAPSLSLVAQPSHAEASDAESDDSGPPSEASVRPPPDIAAAAGPGNSSSSSSSSSSEDSSSDSDSDSEDSDDDGAPLELSSKLADQPAAAPGRTDTRPICRHYLQGSCSYGDRCRKRHEQPDAAAQAAAATNTDINAKAGAGVTKPQRRPQPRAPPPNPFARPDLLHQLLRNEIAKHVNAVAQAIRFIVDNDMLIHVESREGLAEEQRRRRGLVQVVGEAAAPATTTTSTSTAAARREDQLEEPRLEQPLVEGALPVLSVTWPDSADAGDEGSTSAAAMRKSALYRPSSPLLRPLSTLKYPPEPDPLIFLDPLRRDDPKPLLPSQLISIATDPAIRSILTPTSALFPAGQKRKGLERALVSLDALPSDAYRNAAIEMVLGVSAQTPAWAHETYARTAAAARSHQGLTASVGGRKVTETDLFRLGLRVGHEEVGQLRSLADCISRIVQGPEADGGGWTGNLDGQEMGLMSEEQRMEARRRFWEREGEREARLRKLGIDV